MKSNQKARVPSNPVYGEKRQEKAPPDLKQTSLLAAAHRQIIDSIGDAVSILTTEFRLAYQNQAHKALIGEHIGEYCFKAIHDLDEICEDCPVRESFKDGKSHSVERKNPKRGFTAEVNSSPIRDSDGKIVAAMEIVRDTTARKKAEDELKESNARFQALLEAIPDAVVVKDTNLRHIFVNRAAGEAFGMNIKEFLGKTADEVLPADLAAYCNKSDREVLSRLSTFRTEEKRIQNGEEFVSDAIKTPIFKGDSPIGLLMISRDITQLRKNEALLKEIMDNTPNIVYIYDLVEKKNVFANRRTSKYFGYTFEEMQRLGPSLLPTLIHTEDWPRVIEHHKKIVKAGDKDVFDLEYRVKDSQGNWRWLLGHDIVFSRNPDGSVRQILGISEDITERKISEMQMETSLKEKETLLRELYHRTKNNMQVISSLINLQAATVDNHSADVLKDIQARIQAMSLVHEKLYKSKDLSSIDLKGYVEALTRALTNSYRKQGDRIALFTDIEDIPCSIDTITPCGLVLNELVSNAFKYAFPDRTGEISIIFRAAGKDEIEFIFSDNGIGLPPDCDMKKSLGLRLIENLITRQLNGQMKRNEGKGTSFTMRFKRDIPRNPRK